MILSMEYTPDVSGGLGTHVYELANGLKWAECEVHVLACTPQRTRSLRETNLTVHLLSPDADHSSNDAIPSLAGSILAFTHNLVNKGREVISGDGWRPDVIQCYSWLTYQAARRLGRLYGIPVISVIQYVSEPVERWWGQIPDREIARQEEYLFRQALTFITVSQSMRKIIQDVYEAPSDRIHVVYNGMDPRPFVNPAVKSGAIQRLRQIAAQPNEKIVVFAGRFHPHKGIGAVLDSAAQVVVKLPEVRYLMVGEPDSREFALRMKQLLDRHHSLRRKITFLGKIPRRQLAALYQVADVALAPSVYEPFGYASIEAMAAGVPVIASDVGGLGEIISHGQTGLLVPVHRRETEPHVVDVDKLTEAQLTLLGDESMARKLGEAGRRHVLESFSLEKMVQSTIHVYRDTITRFQKAHRRTV